MSEANYTYNYNRIKEVLANKGRTSKELAAHVEKTETTVSTWCTNTNQPPVETFYKIARFLKVDVRELFTPVKELRKIPRKKPSQEKAGAPDNARKR